MMTQIGDAYILYKASVQIFPVKQKYFQDNFCDIDTMLVLVISYD